MGLNIKGLPGLLRGRGGIAAAAAAVLGVILIWGAWGTGPGPWAPAALPELAATGELPALSEAVKSNPALEQRLRALSEKDEGWLFVHYREVDSEIATILLMWAGADMADAGKTAEGIDKRIDTFLRRVHGLEAGDYVTGNPLLGERPWVRWFNHFKPRLMIQMAGSRVYDGDIIYDPARDLLTVEADLSKPFFEGFGAFAAQQVDPAPYVNNLLVFVDATKGFSRLSEEDRALLEALKKPVKG